MRAPRLGLLAVVAVLTATACASPAPQRTVFPALPSAEEAAAAGWELPPVLRASELLPRPLLEGPRHEVDEEVTTDGFVHIYGVHSDFGDFEVVGDDLLRARVHEIRALAELDERSATADFATAAANALSSPFVATWNLVTSPVDTLSGIPAAAWETIRRTSDLARGGRGELEGSALGELIGFESVKRELARQLGVDPYSSNPALQKGLNAHTWASYAGGLPGRFVPFQRHPDAHADLGPGGVTERLDEILASFSPEDLARLNRIELTVMGVSEESRDAFIRHPWYSPRHETLLVGSLSALDLAEDRAAFIGAALGAQSEDDARYYQRVAELLRAYHENAGAIQRIVPVGRSLAGYTVDRTLVVALPVDHAIWTAPTADFARGFRDRIPVDVEAEKTELLLSGTLSERARREVEALGFSVTDNAFERFAPAEATTGDGAVGSEGAPPSDS